VYASVLDRAGRPVTDVAAKDLTVRENSIDRRVLLVSRAVERLDVAVLVDTSEDAEALDCDHAGGPEGAGDGDTAKPALGSEHYGREGVSSRT
jgi:hypothetical protein